MKPAAAVRARARAAAAAVAAARAAAVAADEQSIYVPGGRGAGLREGLPPKKAKPPVLWSKPVTGNFNKLKGRFKVVLAGRGDLNDAGALCIKVKQETMSFLFLFFFLVLKILASSIILLIVAPYP